MESVNHGKNPNQTINEWLNSLNLISDIIIIHVTL
jgi:hypothetical protein